MSDRPVELLWADFLQNELPEAAACLRRQHAEIATLSSASDKLRLAWSREVHGLMADKARLRAECDALLDAVLEVIRVLQSAPPSICDTVWVTGDAPETLLDRCISAAAKATGGNDE